MLLALGMHDLKIEFNTKLWSCNKYLRWAPPLFPSVFQTCRIPASSDLSSSYDFIFSAVSPSLGIIFRQYSLISSANFWNSVSVQAARTPTEFSLVIASVVVPFSASPFSVFTLTFAAKKLWLTLRYWYYIAADKCQMATPPPPHY